MTQKQTLEKMGYMLDERKIPLDVMDIAKLEGWLNSHNKLECEHVGSVGDLEQWRVKWYTLEAGYITARHFGNMLQVKVYSMPYDRPHKPTDPPGFCETDAAIVCVNAGMIDSVIPRMIVRELDAALFELQAQPTATSERSVAVGRDVTESIVITGDHNIVNLGKEAPSATVRDMPAQRHFAKLRQNIIQRFSDGELRDLCFDLGVDYESLPGQGKADKARELITYLERRDRIPELVAQLHKLRPNVP